MGEERDGRGGVGHSSSVLHRPRVPAQTLGMPPPSQDLDLDTASPMSPASHATPRAMPPTMAMPTSPSGEERKRRLSRGQTQSLLGTQATTSGLLLLGRRHASLLESWCEGPSGPGKEEGLRRNCLEGII